VDLGLQGKRALVTGSTAGIGFAAARALAAEGAQVTINGRTAPRVNAAVARLRADLPGVPVTGVSADLGTAAGCEVMIQLRPEPFEEISDADWLRFFETNVLSSVRLTRHYLRGMRERNWGRVVFVSSESAVQIPAEMIHYGMTKTAQLAISRGLAETLTGTGVTVNSVLPGPTSSEGVGQFVRQLAESQAVDVATVERQFFETARPSSIIQRFATPEEVAAMIAYVCGEPASATTGAALRVDGGVIRCVV
jgi:NAD(P)-dependent dehydrogenase (short-subunit alcohol dehydrogenase family)